MSSKYDVAIIGAGVGGLICGCYLAKAGMKILVVEKNPNPGGYCTSFRRKGYVFDSAIRGLVGCGENNILGKIFSEIGVDKEVKMLRAKVFDKIVTPDFSVSIKNDYLETIEDIKRIFPKEQYAIDSFFRILTSTNFLELYSKMKGKSFRAFIDSIFLDRNLRSLWNIMRADTGLLPEETSALAGISLCRGYVLDGGYYPIGGMQEIPDKLVNILCRSGGDIIFSNEVKKVEVKGNKAIGIRLKDNSFIQAKFVISNCDATHTFDRLVGREHLSIKFLKSIKSMITSPSVFIVYLGLNRKLCNIDRCCAVWHFPSRPTNKDFDVVFKNNLKTSSKYVVCVFPSFHDTSLAPKYGESIYLYIGAPYENISYWENNREEVTDDIISRAGKLIPNLASSIEVKETATPHTLQRYTYNRNGASRGWAAFEAQTSFDVVPYETPVERLFLAGHWVTCPTGQGGVAMAAYAGRNVAKIILKGEK